MLNNHVLIISPSQLRKYSEAKKVAALGCFCFIRSMQSADYLLDMFVNLYSAVIINIDL